MTFEIPENAHLWVVMVVAVIMLIVLLFVPYFRTTEKRMKYVESFVDIQQCPTLTNKYCSNLGGNTVTKLKTVNLKDGNCVNLEYCEPQDNTTVTGLSKYNYFYADNYNYIPDTDLKNMGTVQSLMDKINDCATRGPSKFILDSTGAKKCNSIKTCGQDKPIVSGGSVYCVDQDKKKVCDANQRYDGVAKKCITTDLNAFTCRYGGDISTKDNKAVCTRILTCEPGDTLDWNPNTRTLKCVSAASCAVGKQMSPNSCGLDPKCGDTHLDGTVCKNDIKCTGGSVLLKNGGFYVLDDITSSPICQYKY